MVATSVAGRGLDVADLVLVINYHCPNHLEDYVHRVGRTGRAGRKGTAYTFISPEVRKSNLISSYVACSIPKTSFHTITFLTPSLVVLSLS